MGMERIKLVTKEQAKSPSAVKKDPKADETDANKDGKEEEENKLQAGEHFVTDVTNLGKNDNNVEQWQLTLKVPFDGPSEKGVDLLVAEEEEEASKSVLERITWKDCSFDWLFWNDCCWNRFDHAHYTVDYCRLFVCWPFWLATRLWN